MQAIWTTFRRGAIAFTSVSVALVAIAQVPSLQSPQSVALAYAQGARGNCPSVAITKWVIATYGMRASVGAFSITVNADHSESVLLADSRVVTVTPAQELIAAAHSDFNARLLSTEADLPSVEVRKEATDQANRLYAVLAVLKAGQQLDGRLLFPDAFQHSFRHLDDGGDIDSLFELIGFKIVDIKTFPKAIPNVYGSAVHVVFAIDTAPGSYGQNQYDEHGGLSPIQSYDYSNGRHGHRWRYALQDGSAVGTSTIVRQCERSVGNWDACPEFDI